MYLYLIQHGEAKSETEDPERPLTDTGAADAKKSALFFKSLQKEIDVIWHSGKKRAEQTAGILAEVLGAKGCIEKCDGIAPNDDISIIKGKIKRSGMDSICLVGHLPHLSRLAADLLTGNQERGIIHFKNAGIVCLFGENQDWRLEWMVTPAILRGEGNISVG